MEKSPIIKQVLKQLSSQKTKDYTFATIFFIIFSIFIFFAIRPSLVTAFSLRKEADELKELTKRYESAISQIVEIQSSFETLREDLPVLSEALPESPNINKLIKDIEESGSKNSVEISKVAVGEVNLVEKKKKNLNTVSVNMETTSSFENIIKFLKDLTNQRRLKSINRFDISRDVDSSTESATLKIRLEIEGFYL